MVVEKASDEGRFCTNAEASQRFFDSVFDRLSGTIPPPLNGDFSNAVGVAHGEGLRGAGQLVAILDSGFDMTIESLRESSHDASVTNAATVEWRGRHGTVVALLVRAIAPQAKLLLIDVGVEVNPTRARLASALRAAFAEHADVVNISLEFTARLEAQVESGPRSEQAGDASPFWEQVPVLTESILEHAGAGFGVGCSSPCAICATLADKPRSTAIVSAAGNSADEDPVCPSCHAKVIGSGFEGQVHALVNEGDLLVRSLPIGFSQNPFVELSVPQPEGFTGTSFAAPLIAGLLAALNRERMRFGEMLWFPTAMMPASVAHDLRRKIPETGDQEEGAALVSAAYRGYQVVGEHCPAEHQHWLQSTARACAWCAWCMTDWYRDFSTLLIHTGRVDIGRDVASTGSAVNPRSPAIAGNLAVAYRHLADAPERTVERNELLGEAVKNFERAIDLGGSLELFRPLLAEAVAALPGRDA